MDERHMVAVPFYAVIFRADRFLEHPVIEQAGKPVTTGKVFLS